MRVLVTGATGYIGGRLVPKLLENGYDVRVLARDPSRLIGRFPGAEIRRGDVSTRETLGDALAGIDVAYYLVHSMGGTGDFAARDRHAARTFSEAARDAGVCRIVYLGGLGSSEQRISEHLRSRHEVGDVLRESGIAVTEFRAALIVGSGSASFEMLRYLTERLPVMVAPKWVSTRSQPIGIRDVVRYLVETLERPETAGRIFEIGGDDVLTYERMMLRYAELRGLRRRIIVVPFFTPRLSSYWVHLVTPVPASIAQPLILGLETEVIVNDTSAREAFSVRPASYDAAVRLALDRYEGSGPATTWFDAFAVRTLPGQFTGSTEGMLIDRRERSSRAAPAALFEVFSQLGGKRGWLYADVLWSLRGLIDRLAGGYGTRRGRRSQTELRIGDAVDFWRVEAYEPGALLRLRSEMRLPGSAWLQFEALPTQSGSTLRQTAFYEPRGFFGYAYWYAVLPFHELIFGQLARRIVERAEDAPRAVRAKGAVISELLDA